MSLVDPRVKKQADILVNYSLQFKKGETVSILADFEARPLVLETYKLLIQKGAKDVRIHFSDYEFAENYYKYANDEQINSFPELDYYEIKNTDCFIAISAPINSRGLTNVDAEKISARSKVRKPILDYRVENTKWVVTRFPTNAQAQEADMSLDDYADFVFSAINKPDWKQIKKEQEALRKLVDKTKMVRIVGDNTDLSFSIEGRKAVNCFGDFNMPDGEVFTSVVENSTQGNILITFPALYYGKEFHDVRLEFKKGKVVKATASKGEKDLNEIISRDPGAKRIGEFGIGNNYKIKKFSKDTLFDEKIGGTIHLALGRGYKESLSKNESSLHWDMVKDLRDGGELYFDGKLVQKDGKWMVKL